MRRTGRLTLTAMIASLCVICLAGTVLLPQMTLSLTALAGLLPAVTVMVCGYGWAAGGFAVTALLALLLLPDKTAGIWFVCFFGHYPIWKGMIEALETRRNQLWLGWALKLLGFAACMTLLYLAFGRFFAAAISFDFSNYTFGALLLSGALLLAFVAYDFAFSGLLALFRTSILPRLR